MTRFTKTFLHAGCTAVRIPAHFGIKSGEELVISQEVNGALRLERGAPFASFFAATDSYREMKASL